MQHHPPEIELLLLCARSRLEAPLAKRVCLLANNKELDWNVLINAAEYHRLLPLLYKNLQRSCQDLVPVPILQKLRSFYLENAVRNCLFAGTLLKLLTIFKDHEIQAVAFKGPLLTASVYGDLPLRTFGDLDILIEEKDMEKAVQLLRQLGYITDFDLPLETYLKLFCKWHHAKFINPKNDVVVELHWEMSGRYCSRNLGFDYVSPRLETVPLLHQSVLSLGPEDLLLYLCIHGNRHRWMQLDAVCCIAEMLREYPEIDWNLTIKLAKGLGAVRILVLGLVLARNVLGSVIPAIALEAIGNEQVLAPLIRQIERELFDLKTEGQEVMYHIRGLLFHCRSMDRLSLGLKYGIRKICTPGGYDLEWVPLPTSIWFLYPVLRPFRFAVKYGKKWNGRE